MPSSPLRTERCTTYPADVAAIAEGRRQVAHWAADALPPDVVLDLELVASELMANAIAASEPGNDVHVGVSSGGASLVLEVANVALPTPPDTVCWDYDDPLRTGGRGLLIVRSLTDEVDVEAREPWTVVRCAVHRLADPG